MRSSARGNKKSAFRVTLLVTAALAAFWLYQLQQLPEHLQHNGSPHVQQLRVAGGVPDPHSSLWECFCAQRLRERTDAPQHLTNPDDQDRRLGLYRCSDEELRDTHQAHLVYCTFANVCMRRTPEPFVVDDNSGSLIVEVFGGDVDERLPKKLHRAILERKSLASNPMPKWRGGEAVPPSTRYYPAGAGAESLATINLHMHPFAEYHSYFEGMRQAFANLDFAGVPAALRRRVTAIDFFRKAGTTETRDMPKAFNVSRWNDADMPGVTRLCFERRVVLGALWHTDLERYTDLSQRFRTHVIDAHLGEGAAAASSSVCRRASEGRLLFLRRQGTVTNPAFYTYLNSLRRIGFRVTVAEFTSATPADAMVQLASSHDIILGTEAAALVHSLWLPSPCGLLVELATDPRTLTSDNHFFERVVRSSGLDKRMVHWAPQLKLPGAPAPSSVSLSVDVQDFHRELMQYLAVRTNWQITPFIKAVKASIDAHGHLSGGLDGAAASAHSAAECYCAQRLRERTDAPQHPTNPGDRSGLYRCSDEELRDPHQAHLVYCAIANVCVRRTPEPFVVDDNSGSLVVEVFGEDAAENLPKTLHRATLQELQPMSNSPFAKWRGGEAVPPSTRYYPVGAGAESLATINLHMHPFAEYHSYFEGMRQAFANLDFAGVPAALRRNVTAIDFFRQADNTDTRDMPEAFNVSRWNDADMPGVTRLCFERPLLLSAVGHLVLEQFVDLSQRFRAHVIDSYHGVGAAAASNAVCRQQSQGRILYIERPGMQRSLTTATVETYLRSLQHVGFAVTVAKFDDSTPLEDKIKLATEHDVMIGPHDTALVHSLWLPTPCGLVVELATDAKMLVTDGHYFERVVRSSGLDKRMVYWAPEWKSPSFGSVREKDVVYIDLRDFHHEFMQYLSSRPNWHSAAFFRAMRMSVDFHGELQDHTA